MWVLIDFLPFRVPRSTKSAWALFNKRGLIEYMKENLNHPFPFCGPFHGNIFYVPYQSYFDKDENLNRSFSFHGHFHENMSCTITFSLTKENW